MLTIFRYKHDETDTSLCSSAARPHTDETRHPKQRHHPLVAEFIRPKKYTLFVLQWVVKCIHLATKILI